METTAYESIDPSDLSTPNTVYAHIRKPRNVYESAVVQHDYEQAP